jgi:hypothetical protein
MHSFACRRYTGVREPALARQHGSRNRRCIQRHHTGLIRHKSTVDRPALLSTNQTGRRALMGAP